MSIWSMKYLLDLVKSISSCISFREFSTLSPSFVCNFSFIVTSVPNMHCTLVGLVGRTLDGLVGGERKV